MLPTILSEVRDEVYDILWNSKDYFYVSNYNYKHLSPEMKKYSPASYLEDLIETFAPQVRDFATAKELARFIICCLGASIAVDMLVDHCVESGHRFSVKAADGYIDEVEFSKSGYFSQRFARTGVLLIYPSSGLSAANITITFEYTKDIERINWLDLPITINVLTARGSATWTTEVRQLSRRMLQGLLDQVKF